MELSEKSFQILDALDRNEVFNQRQLAEHSGVSLSQVNYLLKRLFEKGLVKVRNFQKNPTKSVYLYLLTPKGLDAKSQVAVRFVKSRLREYNHLRNILTEELTSIERTSPVRIVFVGPLIVKDFVDSIIKEKDLNLVVVGHCNQWENLEGIDPKSFDMALLFDGNAEGVKKISGQLNIPKEKLTLLW